MVRRRLASLGLLAGCLSGGVVAAPAAAQVYSLTSSVASATVAPTGTDFVAGSIATSTITLTVSYVSGQKNTIYNSYVRINCATAACRDAGTKGGLEWRVVSSSRPTEAPATAFTPLVFGATGTNLNATAVQVDGNTRTGAIVSSWTIDVELRYPLAWATDPAGSTGTTNVVFQLVMQP